MTFRLLESLIDGLPPESLTKTAARESLTPDELAEMAEQPRQGHGPWSKTESLLAQIIDHLGWVMYAIYASQGGKPRKPEPVPRPGITKRRLSAKETDALIAIIARNSANRTDQPPVPPQLIAQLQGRRQRRETDSSDRNRG